VSRENVELVKRLDPSGADLVERLEEAEKGGAFLGFETAAGLFAEDFDVEWIAAASTEGFRHRGIAGILEGWREWLSPYESYRVHSEDFLDAGDEVVVLTHIRAKTRRDGVVIEHSPAAVWTIENGKIVRIRFFLERDAALAATAAGSQDQRAGLRLTEGEE
jgi:ketosteroid isomerase-like protein